MCSVPSQSHAVTQLTTLVIDESRSRALDFKFDIFYLRNTKIMLKSESCDLDPTSTDLVDCVTAQNCNFA